MKTFLDTILTRKEVLETGNKKDTVSKKCTVRKTSNVLLNIVNFTVFASSSTPLRSPPPLGLFFCFLSSRESTTGIFHFNFLSNFSWTSCCSFRLATYVCGPVPKTFSKVFKNLRPWVDPISIFFFHGLKVTQSHGRQGIRAGTSPHGGTLESMQFRKRHFT